MAIVAEPGPVYRAVALYPRKSPAYGRKARDKEEISLEYQEQRMRAYCAQRGWTVAAVRPETHHRYMLKSRPALRRLLEECRAGAYDLVLGYDMTRVCAKSSDLGWIETELRDAGGVPLRLAFDDVPEGPYAGVIKSLKAEASGEEVTLIRRRTGEGKEKRMAAKQLPLARVAPYGMVWNHEADPTTAPTAADRFKYLQPRRATPEDATAAVARRLFDDVTERGQTMGDLVRALNAEGVPGPQGGVWSRAGLAVILHNPVYCGLEVTGRTKRRLDGFGEDERWVRDRVAPDAWRHLEAVTHRPLISREQWERAQALIAGRTVRPAREGSLAGRALLRGGLAVCAGCDGPLWAGGQYTVKAERPGTAPAGVTVVYYQCSTRHGVVHDAIAAGTRRACARPAHVRADVLDHAVWEAVLDYQPRAPQPEAPAGAARREADRRRRERERAKVTRELRAGEKKALLVTEPHRLAALEALNEASAARLTALEGELDALAGEARTAQRERSKEAALAVALQQHREALLACRPWAADPAQDDAMQGLVRALGVRALVTRSARPRDRGVTWRISLGPREGLTAEATTTRRGLRSRNRARGLAAALARFR